MPTNDSYSEQANLLVRWHREGNYSLGEWMRKLERFQSLTDREVLDTKFTLTLAQEIVAVGAGYASWAELKAGTRGAPETPPAPSAPPLVKDVIPILLVRDVQATAAYFEHALGFQIDFLHGLPPFYGAVSRDGVCLHLRFVHQPPFAKTAAEEASLLCASFEVSNVQGLFEEFAARGAEFTQKLATQPWGGTDFHVRDPDGNVISFVTYN